MSDMELIYCPYTDREIPEQQTNSEHIIPRSLGGLAEFELPVDAAFNSKAGSEIDGGMADDFLTLFDRRRFDARGISGTPPKPRVKRASFGETEHPVQLEFPESGLEIWDPRGRRYLGPYEMGSQVFRGSIKIDMDIRLRFSAKTALSAGYFAFGDVFREHTAHDEVRMLMDRGNDVSDEEVKDLSLRMYDAFTMPAPDPGSPPWIAEQVCNAVRGSCVIFGYGPRNLIVNIGLLGKYVGMLNFEADIPNFPNEGDYRYGHVIALQNGQIQVGSFAEAGKQLFKQWGVEPPPDVELSRECFYLGE